MFDWFKKHLSANETASSSNAFRGAENKSPDQADLLAQSIAQKKNGDAHFNQGKFAEAAACYREAITSNPDYAEALNNLSNACRELGLFDDAERFLRQAAAIKSLPNVHYNLASLLLEQGKLIEAIENFDKELQFNPKHYAALAIKLHQMRKICKWDDLDSNIETLRHSVAAPAASAEGVCSPFIFMALPGTTAEEQKTCAAKWVHSEYQPLAAPLPGLAFDHKRTRNQKIAIGYLSADFHDHATARLMAEVFELHDHDRFYITAYSYGPDDGSTMRSRLKNSFDQFIDIRKMSDIESAQRIFADHTDILIDLKGLTQNSRSGILAFRPAPLQVNYLGYPGTMGADFVDYLIADAFIIPPEYQKHYSEKIAYLPNCYQPNDRTRPRLPAPTRKESGLPTDHVVFCCFNQTYKITPAIFDIWCRLLLAVPGSVLWLFASTPYSEANLKRETRARGVDPGRLIIAPPLNSEKHLARLQCADLFLDTTPVNAHTTCSDALWMGLPVVTCVGETFPSRVAGSLLSAMGVPELITYNLQDYYRLALDLATDRKKLASIRSKIIANRYTTPLFDSVRFTHDLESAYIRLMEEYSRSMNSK